MYQLKEMPYEEKYDLVLENMAVSRNMTADFVQENLGSQALRSLQKSWGEGMKPIPKSGSNEERYETAYENFIWIVSQNFAFVLDRMDEDGIALFERADVEALKRKNASPTLLLLNLIRAISPKTAFSMTAKEFSYQLQWLTPYSVSELSPEQVVFDIPQCKILDYPNSEHICSIGCQRIYPQWTAEQFKVDMTFNRQGNSCVCTITPVK